MAQMRSKPSVIIRVRWRALSSRFPATPLDLTSTGRFGFLTMGCHPGFVSRDARKVLAACRPVLGRWTIPTKIHPRESSEGSWWRCARTIERLFSGSRFFVIIHEAALGFFAVPEILWGRLRRIVLAPEHIRPGKRRCYIYTQSRQDAHGTSA